MKLPLICGLARYKKLKTAQAVAAISFTIPTRPGTGKLANRVFAQMFGFEGFPPLLRGQKAFHAVTGAHVRGGIYSTVKAEWEHSAPCAMALAVKSLFLFLLLKFIIHSVAAMTSGNLRMCTDQVQEEKLRCDDILHRIQYASVVVLCY